jgi:hypothetical protein
MEFAGDFATISGERREMIDCQARMLHIPMTKKRVSLHAVCPKKAAPGGNTLTVSGGGTQRSCTTFRGNLFELKSLGA